MKILKQAPVDIRVAPGDSLQLLNNNEVLLTTELTKSYHIKSVATFETSDGFGGLFSTRRTIT